MKLLISFIFFFVLFLSSNLYSQIDNNKIIHRQEYQIYLKQPVKEIKLLMYEKSFLPIQGKLSDDRKSIIMKDWETGTRVHVKVLYEDGTEDEFTKSPCFIDPVL